MATGLLCLNDPPQGTAHQRLLPPIPHPVPKVPSPQAQELPATVPKQLHIEAVGCHAPAKPLPSANPTSLTHTAAFVPNCFKLPSPRTPFICRSEATAAKWGSPAEPFPTSRPGAAPNGAKREDQTTLGSLHLTNSSWAPSRVPKTTSGISDMPIPSPHLPQGTAVLSGTAEGCDRQRGCPQPASPDTSGLHCSTAASSRPAFPWDFLSNLLLLGWL